MKNMRTVRGGFSLRLAALFSLGLLAACGGSGGGGSAAVAPSPTPDPGPSERTLDAVFVPGPIPYSSYAELTLGRAEPISSVTFRVDSKPGARAAPVEVTYSRSYLVREGALDEVRGTVQLTVFALYPDHPNVVSLRVAYPLADPLERTFTVVTPADPRAQSASPFVSASVQPGLGLSYMFLQRLEGPMLVDIDGQVRWLPPESPDAGFPFAFDSKGLVLGSLYDASVRRISWLGTTLEGSLTDTRCLTSHHNIEPGKTGLFNTVSFDDGVNMHPESVLAEMTDLGTVTRIWEFDRIFADRITASGEDPALLVQNGVDWFHMNSAIYDASDDSIIASSRENFIVKVDYTTGAIKWILGNPNKLWFTSYPHSLQPLALRVIGTPPIGQHALSVSADGTLVTCFNNGMENVVLPSVGDSTGRSSASVYRIDLPTRTATQILALDGGEPTFAAFCSSAYPTAAGNMLATFSMTEIGVPGKVLVVDDANRSLFSAQLVAPGCEGGAYSAREIRLESMLIE